MVRSSRRNKNRRRRSALLRLKKAREIAQKFKKEAELGDDDEAIKFFQSKVKELTTAIDNTEKNLAGAR